MISRLKKLPYLARLSIRVAVNRLGLAILELGAPRARAYDIPLIVLGDTEDAMSELFFARTALALQMVEQYDPYRLARMKGDFSAIWLEKGGGNHYDSTNRRCVLDWRRLVYASVRDLALTLVHEGVHARVNARGVFRSPMADARRHEALAIRQEILFAEKLPDNEAILAHLRGALDTPWWEPEQLLEQHLDRLRAYGIAPWLVRLHAWRGRRHLAARKQTQATS